MCFTCRITALFIKSSAPIGQSRAGRNPALCASANLLPEKFWCMCEGNGGGVGYLHRVGLCEKCVCECLDKLNGSQFLEASPSCYEFLRTLTITDSWKWLVTAADQWQRPGRGIGPPVPLRWRKRLKRGIKKGVVYVNLAIPQNATAQSPLLFSSFIDTRV